MNMLLAIAFLGMVTQVESRLYDVLSTENRFVSLSVTDVIQRYFTPRRTLLVLLPGTSKVTRDSVAKTQTDEDFKAVDVVLEELNDEMRWPLHMFRICSPPVEVLSDTEEIYGSYVIFLMSERGDDAMGNLMTQLELLKDNLLLNSRAQFLFIVISRTNDMPSDLAFRILNLSWKYMIGNAILMMQSSSYSDQKGSNDVTSNIKANVINLFTFSPYSREQNCSDVKNIMLLDKSYLNVKGEFIRNSDLVLKRSITNLYGCPVKVITYDLPPTVVDISKDGNANCTGLEINILLFILEQMNATAMFSIIPSTNKTLYSIFGEFLDGLDSGSADIAIGSLPVCDILTGSADATVSYFQTSIQWLVPCPKPVHRWQAVFAVFTVFPSSVWLCILLSFVSVVTVMRLLASYSEHFNYTSLQYCLLNIWAVALEVSVHKMPQTFRIRGLFLMWIWVSFALCTVFGAFFTTFLVNPGFERKIKTLDELLDSGIPYGYTQQYENAIRDRTMKISQSTCVNLYTCLENAIKYGNFATISDAFHVDYYRTNLSWHDSHLPVCTLEEDVLKVSIVMYLSKGHPLLERINKVTRSMVEAGMMVKWKNDFMHTTRIHSVSFYGSDFANESDDLDSKYVVFTLLHLQSALFVLLFGYIISVSTVAVELIYCKFYAHHFV